MNSKFPLLTLIKLHKNEALSVCPMLDLMEPTKSWFFLPGVKI